jgi:hypothetical protein
LNSITKKSDDEIEKLFRNVIEEILKGGRIWKAKKKYLKKL